MKDQSGESERVYAEAVAYAESHPEGHGPYNGWCRVAGIPLRAEDCPRCQAVMSVAEAGEILSLRERLAWAMRDADGPNWEASGHNRGDYFRRQADAVLDALGIELVGVATEAGITSGGDFVATSASNASPGDVPLYVLSGRTDRGE